MRPTILSPIQLPNVSEVIYDLLRKQIMTGELSPGQQLNLRELESQLEVSRTPLKLALERLQVEGLISIHPRRGTYVTKFSGQDIRECFQVRIALEAEALRYTFSKHNRERLETLIAHFDQMQGYFSNEAVWLDELPAYMNLDRSAHLQIIALSDNARMREAYERANVQGYIAMMGTRFSHGDTLHTQSEHYAINQALKAGRLDPLLEAARVHLLQAGERAVKRLADGEPIR